MLTGFLISLFLFLSPSRIISHLVGPLTQHAKLNHNIFFHLIYKIKLSIIYDQNDTFAYQIWLISELLLAHWRYEMIFRPHSINLFEINQNTKWFDRARDQRRSNLKTFFGFSMQIHKTKQKQSIGVSERDRALGDVGLVGAKSSAESSVHWTFGAKIPFGYTVFS